MGEEYCEGCWAFTKTEDGYKCDNLLCEIQQEAQEDHE